MKKDTLTVIGGLVAFLFFVAFYSAVWFTIVHFIIKYW